MHKKETKDVEQYVEQHQCQPYVIDEDPQLVATRNGWQCVFPRSNELLLDIDRQEDMVWLQSMLNVLQQNGYVLSISRLTVSPGGNYHAYVTFPRDLAPLERIAWQACLGSDRKRELLSLLRIDRHNPTPTLLFERQ